MKTIGYFTKSDQITDAESAELDIIANAIQYKLRVLNSESSAEFGAGPVQLDFANGTVPDKFKNLPKFSLESGGLIIPGFLLPMITIVRDIEIGDDGQQVVIPFSSLGLSGQWFPYSKLETSLEFPPSVSIDDDSLTITIWRNTVDGYMLQGLMSESPNDNSRVLPIKIL